MVTEWLLGVTVNLWSWLVTAIPAPTAPEWFGQAEAGITAMGDKLGWFGAWAPISLLPLVLTLWAGTWIIGNLLQIAMKIVSYMTLGGGAT
jgi:hypothetical protein